MPGGVSVFDIHTIADRTPAFEGARLPQFRKVSHLFVRSDGAFRAARRGGFRGASAPQVARSANPEQMGGLDLPTAFTAIEQNKPTVTAHVSAQVEGVDDSLSTTRVAGRAESTEPRGSRRR